MKRFIASLFAFAGILTGCGIRERWESDQQERLESFQRGSLYLYIDPEHGCHYLAGGTSHNALTPRLDAKGGHVGCGEVKDPR